MTEYLADATVEADATRLLGVQVRLAGTVSSGRNSRVYCADTAGGTRVAVKRFHRTHSQARNFLQAEYDALRFLWDHEERRVPRPLGVEMRTGMLISEFVDGVPVPTSSVSAADVDEAVDFLVSLKRLAGQTDSEHLPDASDAGFTLQAVIDSVDERRQRLERDGDAEVLGGALGEFLVQQFDPALVSAIDAARTGLSEAHQQELPRRHRTLSPSDFGFHNCLRRSDGALLFHDFEHFGWDDPAKVITDVRLHPAMGLPEALAARFTSSMLHGFSADGQLERRWRALEPLFGLKWCTILLNEFVPSDLARRSFAQPDEFDRSQLLQTQLVKAQNMLHHVRTTLSQPSHRN